MKEIFYADSGWVDINDHAFECEEDCIAFAKERIIAKIGKDKLAEYQQEDPGWLDWQFNVYPMDFHREGQY